MAAGSVGENLGYWGCQLAVGSPSFWPCGRQATIRNFGCAVLYRNDLAARITERALSHHPARVRVSSRDRDRKRTSSPRKGPPRW
jgi:hypothetical protein